MVSWLAFGLLGALILVLLVWRDERAMSRRRREERARFQREVDAYAKLAGRPKR